VGAARVAVSAYWWQVVPNPIPSGMVGDVMVKMRAPLLPGSKVRLATETNRTMVLDAPSAAPDVSVTYVAFSPSLDKAYIYCRNTSAKPIALGEVELIAPGTHMRRASWIPISRLDPGEQSCLIAELTHPLAPGQYVWCAVKAEDERIVGCAVARAYAYFPIQEFLGDDHREELSFDREDFLMPYPQAEAEWAKDRSMPDHRVYEVVGDPVCADASPGRELGASASEVASRAAICRQRDPVHPTFIYMCEFMKPVSYFVYGELTDVVAIDAYPIVMEGASVWRNADYVTLARLASEPRPLYTMAEAFMHRNGPYISGRYPTPEEERLTVYLQLAHGSKGIIYFLMDSNADLGGYEKSPSLRAEIGRLNSELRSLRPYLQISEPIAWPSGGDADLEVHVLLCGDRGVILIIVDKLFQSWPRYGENPLHPGEKPFSYQPRRETRVEVHLPAGMKVAHAAVPGPNGLSDVALTQERDGAVVVLPSLNLATAILLTR
jgi:hypothetical protein